MQSLSPFNEPASPAWCLQLNSRQEGCYFSQPRSHKVGPGATEITRSTKLCVCMEMCLLPLRRIAVPGTAVREVAAVLGRDAFMKDLWICLVAVLLPVPSAGATETST
eukprot:GHRQ01021059.1.p5 GENE.GHRQ01021059.1~~GHRQ01021059.1.p5  ORF type:complete len:108 (-),score=22.11 GHRQ01021059.1:43-366(-)